MLSWLEREFAPRALARWGLVALLVFVSALTAFAQSGGTIQGAVYEDYNHNGRQDTGEPGLAGESIGFVNGVGGGTFEAQTDDNGHFIARNLPAGPTAVLGPVREGLQALGEGAVQLVQLNNGGVINIDLPYDRVCVKVKVDKILWKVDGSGCFDMTFTITNMSGFPIGHLFSHNAPPIVIQSPLTLSPNYIPINPPLANGASQTFTVTVCGVPPGSSFNWDISVHHPDLDPCCTASIPIQTPKCDCFQILDQTIECDAAGNVVWCFTGQVLVSGSSVSSLMFPTPAGLSINPNIITFNPPKNFGETFTACVTITGATAGSTLNLPFIMLDSQGKKCCSGTIPLTIPACSCALPGQCWALKPDYNDKVQTSTGASVPFNVAFPGTVAAITCWADPTFMSTDSPVVSLQNINNYQTTTPPALASTAATDWVPPALPRGYHGPIDGAHPMGLWNLRELGSVFGLTIDKYGNIFVTHTSCYTNDFLGAAGGNVPGVVYMIKNVTGQIYKYCVLPQQNPVAGVDPELWPGLGNITYNGINDQLYVTNLEDGKIYRIAGTGGAATTGAVLSSYDPTNAADGWTPDDGSKGMVNIGDRLWGVQYHQGRVYFARWRCDNGQQTGKNNEIWSIGTNAAGDFAGNPALEIVVPFLPNSNYSAPVSDISFSKNGKMMIAERGVGIFGGATNWTTNPQYTAHSSRDLEYECQHMKWVPSAYTYNVGQYGSQINSAGGVDYDYATQVGNPNFKPRVWFTGNALYNIAIYGIQGSVIDVNGNYTNSFLQDADGMYTSAQKASLGDVEIPCPPQGPIVVGRATLLGRTGGAPGREIKVELYRAGTSTLLDTATGVLDGLGNFSFATNVTGQVDMKFLVKCYLVKKLSNINVNGGQILTMDLVPGDIDGDNVVSVFDYGIFSDYFDWNSSMPGWETVGSNGFAPVVADLDGDGAVTVFDYGILSDYFDAFGD